MLGCLKTDGVGAWAQELLKQVKPPKSSLKVCPEEKCSLHFHFRHTETISELKS